MTRMILRVSIPAAPMPVIARPSRNMGKSAAPEVTNAPIAKINVETKIHHLGEKI